MSFIKDKANKKLLLSQKINSFFQESYFDVQGINPGFPNLDEAYLARVLTKLAVGSATVWWSLLEVKDFIKLKSAVSKKATFSSYDIPRKDTF